MSCIRIKSKISDFPKKKQNTFLFSALLELCHVWKWLRKQIRYFAGRSRFATKQWQTCCAGRRKQCCRLQSLLFCFAGLNLVRRRTLRGRHAIANGANRDRHGIRPVADSASCKKVPWRCFSPRLLLCSLFHKLELKLNKGITLGLDYSLLPHSYPLIKT